MSTVLFSAEGEKHAFVHFQFIDDSKAYPYFDPLASWAENVELAKAVREAAIRRRRSGLTTKGYLVIRLSSANQEQRAA